MPQPGPDKHQALKKLGFTFDIGGTHASRTMMFDELAALLNYVDQQSADSAVYARAIEAENCLGKPSGKTRQLTRRHLRSLYALDPDVLLFRALLYCWQRDESSRPLLAILCVYCRDAILRDSARFILNTPVGQLITREDTEAHFDKKFPGRFSPATLKSLAQNINGTWTRAGHLAGKLKKVRSKPEVSAGAMTYALLLSYLSGGRGINLFSSDYVKLLDCGKDRALELAEEASRRGWLIFKGVGDVIEVLFPKLLTPEEQELVREQA